MGVSTNNTPTGYLVLVGTELSPAVVDACLEAARAAGGEVGDRRSGRRRSTHYVEVPVSGVSIEDLRTALGSVPQTLPGAADHIDAVVVPASLRSPGRLLLVMDVDSTYIQDEVIELIAAHAGRQAEVVAATEAAMRGEVDFAASLRSRVAALEGVPVEAFDAVRRRVRFTPGSRELSRAMLGAGHAVVLVSGGFAEVVAPLASEGGITRFRANRLGTADGRLTGQVDGEIIDAEAKRATLLNEAAEAGVDANHIIAVGDGANDLLMLDESALGLAFNAKPLVQQQADATLEVPDLDIILDILGIRD